MRAFKTEINPTAIQAQKIRRTLGGCRYVYNLFLATNEERYQKGEPFLSAYDFSKWLNHEYATQPEYAWSQRPTT